jgi:acetyl-CoA carboxylase carboxyl transferase subunit beta
MTDNSSTPFSGSPSRKGREQMASIPVGSWLKCPKCSAMLYLKELERNLRVCTQCSYHFPLATHERLALLSDEDSFTELDHDLSPRNVLDFPGYEDKLTRGRAKAGQPEAFMYGDATIDGLPVVLGVVNFAFMGGSMGWVMGEKVTRALERGVALDRPVVLVAASGGARMQEGMISLTQMAKTAAAVARLKAAGQVFLSILTDPTTAGVWASFASLGDIIIAEPGALVGFAGPRVIEQSLKVKLPPGTHTSEFQCAHGMVDMVTHRRELRMTVSRLLSYLVPGADARVPSSEKGSRSDETNL